MYGHFKEDGKKITSYDLGSNVNGYMKNLIR